MFDVLDRPLHWVPVKWPGLKQGDDENAVSTTTEHEVELRVELVDRDEAVALFPRVFGDEEAETPADIVEDAAKLRESLPDLSEPASVEMAIFKRVVKGWRKIKAAGRVPEFNDENIRLLLKAPMFPAAFTATYVAALGGRVAVREGNSDGLPSGGQAGDRKAATKAASSEIAAGSE